MEKLGEYLTRLGMDVNIDIQLIEVNTTMTPDLIKRILQRYLTTMKKLSN